MNPPAHTFVAMSMQCFLKILQIYFYCFRHVQNALACSAHIGYRFEQDFFTLLPKFGMQNCRLWEMYTEQNIDQIVKKN